MNDDERERITSMVNEKPIPNPCPMMESFGYKYEYRKGLIDKTPYYTRVEEDSLVYTSNKYILRFNLASRVLVISMVDDNAIYYGGKPTLFFDTSFIHCINEIMKALGWDE